MRRSAIITVMLLLLSGLVINLSNVEVEADAPVARGNTLYVGTGSTYSNLVLALNAAVAGDTIFVGPGTYGSTSVAFKENLTIIGNATAGQVKFQGSVEFIPFGFYQSSNISVSGLYFDGGGTTMSIRQSHNITLEHNTYYSRSNSWDAVMVSDSDKATISYSTITSGADDAFAIEIDNSNNFFSYGVSVAMSGTGGGVLEAVNSENAVLRAISGTYSGDFVDAQGSTITSVDNTVSDDDVTTDPTSSLSVEWFRRIMVKEEDNITRLGGVEMVLEVEGAYAYYTPHYGGTDPVSNDQGIFPDLPNLVEKIIDGSSDPYYHVSTLWFYHDSLDVPTELEFGEVDADRTDDIHVVFPDLRKPYPPRDVTARTIDHDTILIRFDDSTSDDVVRYEIWHDGLMGWSEVLNTSVSGNHGINNLEPDTMHEFRIRAIDDAGLGSEWVLVSNTTDPSTEGILTGTVYHSGGPLDGDTVPNATVRLSHVMINGSVDTITDAIGSFDLGVQPFMDNYTITVVPSDAVEEASDVSGYMNLSYSFNHTEDEHLLLSVQYQEYVPPTYGTISGRVTYADGPLQGRHATNASAYLHTVEDGLTYKLGNYSINETGMYEFKDVPFGANYTVYIHPEDYVNQGGMSTGYVGNSSYVENFTSDLVIDLSIYYYIYHPPTTGAIDGDVRYMDGPKDNIRVIGAEVELLLNGTVIGTNITNDAGRFKFYDVLFGYNYSLRAYPLDGDAGQVHSASGYLSGVSGSFEHSSWKTTEDVGLPYYEFISEHPSITILDDDGDPVKDVVVTIDVDGQKYIAVTDENGVAEFDELEGLNFPDGTTFKAAKDGYDDLEWTEGEDVPVMKEGKDEDPNNLLIVLIIVLVLIVIIVAMYLLFKKGGPSDDYEE